MLVAVFLYSAYLFCLSITLHNRIPTVDVLYLQRLCKAWFVRWLCVLCKVAALPMLILLPLFYLLTVFTYFLALKLLPSLLQMLLSYVQMLLTYV
jgi:hypothetical protein